MSYIVDYVRSLRVAERTAGYVRTGVPLLVAAGVGWGAVKTGYTGPVPELGPYVGHVAAFGYYALVRVVEKRFPKFGILLGIPKAPTYAP